MNILPIHSYEEYLEIDPGVYNFINDNKKEIEHSLDMHNNMNILASIWWYVYLIFNSDSLIENNLFTLEKLKESVSKWEKPDFTNLLGFIRMNYNGDDLHWNKDFNKLLKAINILSNKIDKKNLEYNQIKINFEDVKHSVRENISHFCNIDDYLINFKFSSYLWIDFYITPVLITLIIDLVHNSIKYSNIWTQINITVNQTKEAINISIADEWYWIKYEDIGKIFEYWKRLDNVWDEEWNGIWWAKLINEINKLWWELFIKSKVWVWTEVLFIIPNKK